MGGGNAQKSAKAREDALKKAGGNKTPEERKAAATKAKSDSEAVKCSICLQAFMCTAKIGQLIAHVDSKHAKTDPLTCFPCIPQMQAAEEAAVVSKAAPTSSKAKLEAAGAKATKGKKKGKEDDLSAMLSEGLKVGKKK
mmetsp:Transcript_64928/g.130555  ORF Transcript_64928/g.130555 Transcript_64928/m.130555 type:complete len:139 (-) Transcript_64928:237-653(-)